MFDNIYVGDSVADVETFDEFDGYSGVLLKISDDESFFSGTETGRILEAYSPFGTQQIADNMISMIRGFRYKPYFATDAIIDAAAEIGDGVTIGDVYSGIHQLSHKFNSVLPVSLSAPSENELDHEFPYKSSESRKIARSLKKLTTELSVQDGKIIAEIEERKNETDALWSKLSITEEKILLEVGSVSGSVLELASNLSIQEGKITAEISERKKAINSLSSKLEIQASQISAKVSSTSENENKTFGWELKADSWVLKSGGKEVFRVDSDGASVLGEINATTGTIGGFTIQKNYLSYNNQSWNGTNNVGVYIGESGIQCGKNFRVDNQGNLFAASGTFTGPVSASQIRFGVDDTTGIDYGTLNGAAISAASINTTSLSQGINTSLGFANFANTVFNNGVRANYIYANNADFTHLGIGQKRVGATTLYYIDHNGNKRTVTVAALQ